MVKKIIYCLLLLIIGVLAKGQTWSPVGTGISGPSSVTTWSLYSYDSILYAGGWFDTAGGMRVNDMAQWNGVNWNVTGTGTSGYINAMAVYNGNLYVGGLFDSIGGIAANSIAMWNGKTWSTVGKGFKTAQYNVYALAVYNGELYAGGAFDSADGKSIYGIAKWDGTNWSSLGTGIYAADEEDGVFALAVYKGELYAGGGFDSAGGVPVKEIAKWNGTNWSAVGRSMNDGGAVYSLAVYNNSLYAGGMFDTASGVIAHRIAMWNGSNWAGLDSGITGEAGWASVSALISYNGKLYAGGYFDTVNGKPINCIAAWDGSSWSPLGSGISNGGSVTSFAIYNNALYVAGGFDSAGGVYAHDIAMWNAPTSINEINKDFEITIFPNPTSSVLFVKNNLPYSEWEYKIYNELGQQIENGNFSSCLQRIDVSTLPEGLYMISVSANEKQYNYKFIKN